MQVVLPYQNRWRYSPFAQRSAWLRLMFSGAILTALLLAVPAWSDQTGWPPRPDHAEQAEPIAIARADLEALQEGSEFQFALPGAGLVQGSGQTLSVIHGRVTHHDRYPDNDQVLRGEGVDQDVSFVLTLGKKALFADLGIGDQRWVLSAEGDDTLRGWFYQPAGTMGSAADTDFVIPRHDPARRRLVQPLTLQGPVPDNGAELASQAGLQISQRFSQDVVTLGETADVEVVVEFRNQGSRVISALDADIYFILEDATLISAPACRRRTTASSQPVLSCELAGTLAPGGSRSFSYIVRIGPRADVGRVVSTVLTSQVRDDAYINVVNDVVGDGAGVGAQSDISPFNQQLAAQSNIDRLGNVVIDVMALYTPDAQSVYGIHTATRINQLISVANQIYHDSGIGITLRPVYHHRVDYLASQASMHTMLEQLTYGEHPAFADVAGLRERYGADMVVLFRPLAAQNALCGLANLGGHRTNGDLTAFGDRDFAYSLAAIDCPVSSVLAHELGHNMGLTHSHREDGSGGTFRFATGHGVDHSFATVMANPKAFSASQRIPLFSSPALSCAGMPCGVDHQDRDHGADAVRTLNLVRFQVAAYMPTRVADRPGRQAGSIDGGLSATYISMAASTDKGLSNADSVDLSQTMDISAEFYVDPAHVGQRGHFHVLADLSSAGMGFVQLTDSGEVFDWNGNVDTLVAFNDAESLKAVEYLRILNDFKPLPELAGSPIVLFVAYRLIATGELIYTLEPMVVDITRSTP